MKADKRKAIKLGDITPEMCPRGSLYLYNEESDAYYASAELLIEEYLETGDDDGNLPKSAPWVLLCVDDQGNMPDAETIAEWACEEMSEDALGYISDSALAELNVLLRKWWSENRPPGVVPGAVVVDLEAEFQAARAAVAAEQRADPREHPIP